MKRQQNDWEPVKRPLWLKLLRFIGVVVLILALIIVVPVGILLYSLSESVKENEYNQAHMHKPDSELIGTRLSISREAKAEVQVNYYYPEDWDRETDLPVVLNIHGGAFISGDADTLDSQSQRLANDWGAFLVAVNYALASDTVTIEYAVEEVTDTVLYFADHAAQYGIDPNQIVLMGYSAGGYHAMASAVQLKEQGFSLAAQVLCYPYIRDILDIYGALPEEEKLVAPALFLIAATDPISQGALPYKDALSAAGVQTETITYADALHGFLEENNPEYEGLYNLASKNPEQEVLARKAEQEIGVWLQKLWDGEEIQP